METTLKEIEQIALKNKASYNYMKNLYRDNPAFLHRRFYKVKWRGKWWYGLRTPNQLDRYL